MDVGGGLLVPDYQVSGAADRMIGRSRGNDFLSFFKPDSSGIPGDEPTFDVHQPLAYEGNSEDFFRYINWFRESVGSLARSYPSKSGTEMQPQIETTSMKAGSYASSHQSTELTIRTRDGDLVTIRIRENEQTAASLQIVNQKGRVGDDSSNTQLETYHQQEAVGSWDLNAVFANGEVSDISMEMDAKSREYAAANYRIADGDGQTTASYRSLSSTSSHLSFEVKGSLDEEELKAIGALIEDVDALANEFFDGDVQVAFSKALQLGYDDTEIAGYALNLIERETTIVAYRYQYSADEEKMPVSVGKPIADYANRLKRIQETANLYFEMKTLEVMMDRIAKINARDNSNEKEGVEASERFREFNERILNSMLEWLG